MQKRILLFAAAALMLIAIRLPLWGMTLVSVQYPEALRMVVYPTAITGDVTEINLLNHYIGMTEITDDYFAELRVIPAAFMVIALTLVIAGIVRKFWSLILPLVLMCAVAVYGFTAMHSRLYEFGTNLDPTAAMKVEPFVPPMFGTNVIAQFATWAYFSWGMFLPVIAGAVTALVLLTDFRSRVRAAASGVPQGGNSAEAALVQAVQMLIARLHIGPTGAGARSN